MDGGSAACVATGADASLNCLFLGVESWGLLRPGLILVRCWRIAGGALCLDSWRDR
jgi:hypothetical protein